MTKRYVLVVVGTVLGARDVLAVYGPEHGGYASHDRALLAQSELRLELRRHWAHLQATVTIVPLGTVGADHKFQVADFIPD